MKKMIMKIITIIMALVIILISNISSHAATANIELNLKGETTIPEDQKTVELFLSTGNFTGIEENIVLGYEAILEYDTTMFKSIKVEGLNGWSASYEESTKVLIGDVATAKANTNITKITLTLKDEIKANQTGKVKLNNLQLTDGTNDFTFNKELAITVQDSKTEQNNTNTNKTNNNTTVNKNNTTTISKNATNTDKTTANTKIPAAGIRNIFIVIITVILVTGIISLIRYKTIKLK